MEIIAPDSESLRSSLLASLKQVPPSKRVVLIFSNGRALAEALLACFEAGIVSVPIDLRTTSDQVRFIVQHSDAFAILHEVHGFTIVNSNGADSPADDRFIMYTSGSTGNPKGVVLTEDAVKHNAMSVAKLHDFSRPHGTCLPMFHCNAIMMSLMGCHFSSGKLLLVSKFQPSDYFASIRLNGVRTASIVPALLHRIIEERPVWPDSLDYLITAAAPLSQDLSKKFYRIYGSRLRQGYGMTEAVNFSAVMPLLDESSFREEYILKHPPVGLPLIGTELRIEEGEVQLRGPNLMREYWRNPSATTQAFTPDGWLKSGDLGEIRDNYLVLRGRKKEVINRGGETIYPIDIEQVWADSGVPRPFFAVGISNEILSDDIGLVTPLPLDTQILAKISTSRYSIGAAEHRPLSLTSTGKPQRARMGQGLRSYSEDLRSYETILGNAIYASHKIITLSNSCPALTGSAKYILRQANMLCDWGKQLGPLPHMQSAFAEAFDFLIKYWPSIASADSLKAEPWNENMESIRRVYYKFYYEKYVEIVATYLQDRDLLKKEILEINDKPQEIMPLKSVVNNFGNCDHDTVRFSPDLANVDVIVSVNSINSVKDKLFYLKSIRALLHEEGQLILAVALPETRSKVPLAMNLLYGLIVNEPSENNLLNRYEWINLLYLAGFSRCGYSQMRSGGHDLGGLIWAYK